MPTASEMLTGLKDKVRKAGRSLGDVMLEGMDSIEQRSRDPSRPPTDVDKAWDSWQRIRREGNATPEQLESAERDFIQKRDFGQ